MREAMRMILAILITLAAVAIALLCLANLGMSGAFAAKVPGGADAMGLFVPFATSVLVGVLLLAAAAMSAARGDLGWISGNTAVAVGIAVVVAIGIGAASVGMMIAWMERMGSWVPVVGVVCAGIAPVAAAGLLAALAWSSPDATAQALYPKLLGWPLVATAAVGYGLGVRGLVAYVQQTSENHRQQIAEVTAQNAEAHRRQNLTPAERLREDYAAMDAKAPLWAVIAPLPDVDDAESRSLIVARSLQVPDLDAEMARTLASDHPRYRHGCADVIRGVESTQLRPQWAAGLAEAIRMTASELSARADWFQPDEMSNPRPLEHLRSLRDAAERFAHQDAIRQAMDALRSAVAALPDSDIRAKAVEATR